jgi:hypothetical protein
MHFDELLQENYKMVGVNYRPTLELTEQQIDEIQQIFIDEGIGQSLAKFLGPLVGAGVAGELSSVAGAAIGGLGGYLAFTMGFVSVFNVINVITVSAITGTLAGWAIGGTVGAVIAHKKIKMLQSAPTIRTSAKIDDVTKKRDRLLEKIAEAADRGKEDTSSISKVEQLTKEQQKLGRELQSVVKKDKQDGLISNEESKSFTKVAKVAAQGKLTNFKSK